MTINRSIFSVVALGVAIAMTIITSAYGQDYDEKRTTGAICMARKFSDQKYLQYNQYGVENRSGTRSVMVTCPLLLDKCVDNSLEEVIVGIKQSSKNSTRCWLRSVNKHGKQIDVEHESVKGTDDIIFGHWVIKVSGAGTVTLQCNLSPKATLRRIYITEN